MSERDKLLIGSLAVVLVLVIVVGVMNHQQEIQNSNRPVISASPAPVKPEIVSSGFVDSLDTSGGVVRKGMTWDEALPLLGDYDDKTPVNADTFTATYSIRGKNYTVTFQRPGLPDLGPYRITGLYKE